MKKFSLRRVFLFLYRGCVLGLLAAVLFAGTENFSKNLSDPDRIAGILLSAAIPASADSGGDPLLPALPPEETAFTEEKTSPDAETKTDPSPILPPEGSTLIRRTDLSSPPGSVINQTPFDPFEPQTVFLPIPDRDADGPVVLVLHTHGTESFSENGEYFTEETPTRTSQTDRNVVAVGDAFCEELTGQGIGVLHCRTLFDLDSYNDAYRLSGEAVASYLEEYPSLRFVFDIHRDSISYEDGSKARLLSESGKAQIMFVVGSDEAGADHPFWRKNLALAFSLNSLLALREPTLTRAVNLRSASFNQQLSGGFLLVEIGSCGNTLAEAKEAAITFADVFYDYLSK